MLNEGVLCQETLNCVLCNAQGALKYEDTVDRLFGAPGSWNLLQCPRCSLIWLSPRPLPEEGKKIYRNYYTHLPANRTRPKPPFNSFRKKVKQALLIDGFGYKEIRNGKSIRWFGKFLSVVPFFREVVGLGVMNLHSIPGGRLLDIGCGNGEFLFKMKGLGWNVIGVETDEEVVKTTQKRYSFPIFIGTLRSIGFDKDSFDAITMHHVIEHIPDFIECLHECFKILKPKGELVIVTPNVESFGHRLFKNAWRELDPPRHFYLFSPKVLIACVEKSGLQIKTFFTSFRSSRWTYMISKIIQKDGRCPNDLPTYISWQLRMESLSFQLLEYVLRPLRHNIGEEIVLVASKKLS